MAPTPADWESRKIFAAGFIVKENCPYPSNWRNRDSLSDYLTDNGVVGFEGIDTRKLVRHIRTQGAMRGIISSTETKIPVLRERLDHYPGLVGRDIVKDVTIDRGYTWDKGVVDVISNDGARPTPRYKVVADDYGMKTEHSSAAAVARLRGEVVPRIDTAEEILARKPDGVFLSNGPGDPAAVTYAIQTIRDLLGKLPIFGICLGHQILGLALGGKTYKLKFGHRGANHPVKNFETGEIEITSQNHGFCVDMDSLKGPDVELTHLNLNDQTARGSAARS